MRMNGKVAVVTGSGAGIGKGIAETFSRQGAKIVGVSRRSENGLPVIEEIKRSGGEGIFIKCDVSVEAEVAAMVKDAMDIYGRIDVLVNNAGVNFVRPFEDITPEDWDRVIGVDLRGTYLCIRNIIPAMLSTGGGSIINISSVHAHACEAGAAPYDAAKWGMVGLTKSLAVEFGGRNIRVNLVSPGAIRTQIYDDYLDAVPDQQQFLDWLHSNIPLERVGTVEEVAEACVFLASDEASYVTGTNIYVDGGMTSQLYSRQPATKRPIEGKERRA